MIYQKEIERAIMWLFDTQNRENFGWSWVSNISPNEQNTAEVVYATALFCQLLSKNQKLLVNEAVKKWLLMPRKHAVLTIDWAWVGLALSKYWEKYDVFAPDFQREYIEKDIGACVEAILSLQNADGGWADCKNDMSTAFRTCISVIFLENQVQNKGHDVDQAVERGVKWLLALQNEDGGFGNLRPADMTQKVLSYYAGVEQHIVEKQYRSSASATGYAMWALSCRNKFLYGKEIERAAKFLKELDVSSGYEIFFEVGIRRSTLFTFRHFGAAWMGIGLLYSGKSKFTSGEIVKLIKYFLRLQDPINGGFPCSDASEVYTWSNSNALMFLRLVVDGLESMSGIEYTDIIVDYFVHRQEE